MTNRQAAVNIIRRLTESGFEALLAGGCVRDMLLKKRASDYDVASNAAPEQVVKLFRRTLKVGAKFGVVIVLFDDQQVQVATFRTETGYHDGRHPSKVRFTTASEDAARRDFTINGMFYDPIKRKIIDYVGGREDLRKGVIRTIGEPQERFSEDYLRMLRAVRFAARLGFTIEPKTRQAICRNAANIAAISGERKCMELEGILTSPQRSAGAALMLKTGLTHAIFPNSADEKILYGIDILGRLRKKIDFPLALAAFFAGCETEFALQSCKALKLSGNQHKHMQFLLDNRGRLLKEDMSLAELKILLAEPYFSDLYELQRAIQSAAGGEGKISAPLLKLRRRIKSLGNVELKPKPLLNGYELMRLGAAAGPVLGQLSQEMYIKQLEGELHTPGQAAIWVQNWLKEHRSVEN